MSDNRCPVSKCKNKKEDFHLVCLDHWGKVPKEIQRKIYRLYKKDQGGKEHRELCFSVLSRLNRGAIDERKR